MKYLVSRFMLPGIMFGAATQYAFGQGMYNESIVKPLSQSRLGVSVGAISFANDDITSNNEMVTGVFLDYDIMPNLQLGFTFDYFQNKFTKGDLKDSDVQDLVFGLNSKLFMDVGPTLFKPFVGLGVAGHWLEIEKTHNVVDASALAPVVSEQTSKSTRNRSGVDAIAGVSFSPQKRLDFLANVSYRAIEQKTDLNHWGLTGGMSYSF